METIKVPCVVSLAAALAHGSNRYGECDIELSADDVKRLSLLAMRQLARLLPASTRYFVDEPTVEAAINALEKAAADRAKKEAEEAEAAETRIKDALDAPLEAWIKNEPPRLDDFPAGSCYLRDEEIRDPRMLAQRARAEKLLPAAIKAYEAKKAAELERKANEKAEREAREQAIDRAIREVASRHDDLARAAKEGYSVTSKVLDRLAENLVGRFPNDTEAKIDSDVWKYPSERSAPNPKTFALLDSVTTAVKLANETLPTALGKWEVSRIMRVDVCPHRDKNHYVTAILATLRTPEGTRQITFSIEPQECDHRDEDEDDI